jgi:hypothetical protein
MNVTGLGAGQGMSGDIVIDATGFGLMVILPIAVSGHEPVVVIIRIW